MLVVRTTFVGLLILCAFIFSTSGQVRSGKKFSAVPKQVRDRLVERFNLYVELDRAQQYDKLFDLYSAAIIKNQKLGKESFVRLNESTPVTVRTALLEYKPVSVSKATYTSEEGVYEIVGRAKVRRDDKVVEEERILEARLQDRDWFFSVWLQRT